VSNIQRLRVTDCIFFVCVNLRPKRRRFDESEYALLIHVLKESRRRLGFLLCGYVLMPDHWHALIWPSYPLLIWQVLHDAKKIMTLRINARRGAQGPLWQHQFWDRFVRHERELNERLDYMHLNPVRKGLVKKPEDWRWSSYNNFALDKATVTACPIRIDYVHLPPGYRP
jgi:REP element-mobilizing transposase RayT